MVDVNNNQIEEGNFLCITGCKVKNDNGIYIVNKQYENGEYCLYKVKQDGNEAQTKYNIYFLNDRSDKDKTVKVVSKEELKNAAKEVKDYLNGVTGSEVVYSFSVSDSQTVEQGKYLYIKKAILLNGHTNQFCGNYEIEKVYDNGGVFLHLMGKRGEKVASNANGYYQFTPINLKFSGETVKQLFEEGYIEILERSSTTKAEIKKENKEDHSTKVEEARTESTENTIEEAAEHIENNEESVKENSNTTSEAETKANKTVYKRDPVYYSINEEAARTSQAMWSFSDYHKGSATASYQNKVNEVFELAAKVTETKPESAERAYSLAARFSKKYADHINTGFQIAMMCPSVMISGGSNFPVRKKEKQNAREDKHWEEYNYIMGIPAKIESILYGRDIIKSNDENAIERLQEKVFTLTEELEKNKEMNKYYRKNKTMKGFDGITDEQAEKFDNLLKNAVPWAQCPAPSFDLTSIRNKIKAAEDRIREIQRLKETASEKPTEETDKYKNDFCKVVENAENMRIQLFFEGKPEENIRSLLKSNGFRWAPSEGAWQRQLTDNGRYATKMLIKKLSEKTA